MLFYQSLFIDCIKLKTGNEYLLTDATHLIETSNLRVFHLKSNSKLT